MSGGQRHGVPGVCTCSTMKCLVQSGPCWHVYPVRTGSQLWQLRWMAIAPDMMCEWPAVPLLAQMVDTAWGLQEEGSIHSTKHSTIQHLDCKSSRN